MKDANGEQTQIKSETKPSKIRNKCRILRRNKKKTAAVSQRKILSLSFEKL